KIQTHHDYREHRIAGYVPSHVQRVASISAKSAARRIRAAAVLLYYRIYDADDCNASSADRPYQSPKTAATVFDFRRYIHIVTVYVRTDLRITVSDWQVR